MSTSTGGDLGLRAQACARRGRCLRSLFVTTRRGGRAPGAVRDLDRPAGGGVLPEPVVDPAPRHAACGHQHPHRQPFGRSAAQRRPQRVLRRLSVPRTRSGMGDGRSGGLGRSWGFARTGCGPAARVADGVPGYLVVGDQVTACPFRLGMLGRGNQECTRLGE